jgi:molybdenum cofactor biosynthesis protein B
MSDSAASHRQQAAVDPAALSVRCAVLTISDTRTLKDDPSGSLIERLLGEAGHDPVERRLVPDDASAIAAALEPWLAASTIQAVLTTGGTGISRRDTTIEVVRGLLTAELDGFGELFRMISHAEIGSAAMLSRAVGGLVARDPDGGGDTFIFTMPGSANAVRTAMDALVIPELRHLVWERRR